MVQQDFCHSSAEMAERVMYLRQQVGGQPSFLEASLSAKIDDPVVRGITRELVAEAYRRPQMASADDRAAASRAFSNEFYRNCMSDR